MQHPQFISVSTLLSAPLLVGLLHMPGAAAQPAAYPNKPVTIILPFAAGGPNDVENRMYSPLLQAALEFVRNTRGR